MRAQRSKSCSRLGHPLFRSVPAARWCSRPAVALAVASFADGASRCGRARCACAVQCAATIASLIPSRLSSRRTPHNTTTKGEQQSQSRPERTRHSAAEKVTASRNGERMRRGGRWHSDTHLRGRSNGHGRTQRAGDGLQTTLDGAVRRRNAFGSARCFCSTLAGRCAYLRCQERCRSDVAVTSDDEGESVTALMRAF